MEVAMTGFSCSRLCWAPKRQNVPAPFESHQQSQSNECKKSFALCVKNLKNVWAHAIFCRRQTETFLDGRKQFVEYGWQLSLHAQIATYLSTFSFCCYDAIISVFDDLWQFRNVYLAVLLFCEQHTLSCCFRWTQNCKNGKITLEKS